MTNHNDHDPPAADDDPADASPARAPMAVFLMTAQRRLRALPGGGGAFEAFFGLPAGAAAADPALTARRVRAAADVAGFSPQHAAIVRMVPCEVLQHRHPAAAVLDVMSRVLGDGPAAWADAGRVCDDVRRMVGPMDPATGLSTGLTIAALLGHAGRPADGLRVVGAIVAGDPGGPAGGPDPARGQGSADDPAAVVPAFLRHADRLGRAGGYDHLRRMARSGGTRLLAHLLDRAGRPADVVPLIEPALGLAPADYADVGRLAAALRRLSPDTLVGQDVDLVHRLADALARTGRGPDAARLVDAALWDVLGVGSEAAAAAGADAGGRRHGPPAALAYNGRPGRQPSNRRAASAGGARRRRRSPRSPRP